MLQGAVLAPQVPLQVGGASGQATGSREQALEPLQLPQPAILLAPQPQPSTGTMSVALPDTQQLYNDLKKDIQNLIVRLTALEKQVESLMRSMPKHPQIRILTPQEVRDSRGALAPGQVPPSKK